MEKKILVTLEEKQKTRKLYEDTFQTEGNFSTFYFEEKCKDNMIYTLEENGEIASMLHLNPYTAILNCYPGHVGKDGDHTEHVVNTYYMTSAVTKPEFRKQGKMQELLTDAINDLYEAKVPFVYLRPISDETAFKPFQFRYIWDRQLYQVNSELIPFSSIEAADKAPVEIQGRGKDVLLLSVLQEEEYQELATFMDKLCYENYGLFMQRNQQYVERLQMAYVTRGGNVYIFRSEKGNIQGYFACRKTENDTVEVREFGLLPKYEDLEYFMLVGEKEPCVMARVIHLETLLKNIHSKKAVDICMKVTDPIIEKNNGTFLLRTSIFGTRIERMTKSYYENMWEDENGKDHPEEIETTVDKLLSYVFGYKSFEDCFTILSNVKGIEDEISYKVKCLRPYGLGCINEMV